MHSGGSGAMAMRPNGIAPEAWDALASPRRWELGRLAIPQDEVLRYLGYRGQELEPELAARIDAAISEAEGSLASRGVSAAFAVDATGADGAGNPCIRLARTAVVLTGRDAYRHLKDARAAVVLAVTLGMESERRLRLLGNLEPLGAALYDAACSALVEEAAESLDRAVKREAARFGLRGNWRFSCGYGDLPLDAQQGLLDALDARRALGITLTPSNLMVPSKSITAVFGLFPAGDGSAGDGRDGGDPLPAADAVRSCRGCTVAAGCAFRARNTTCWR